MRRVTLVKRLLRDVRRGVVRRRTPRGATPHYQKNRTMATAIITRRLHELSTLHGFEYGRVTIRNQRTRWGSCSSRKNLNFSYRVAFLPVPLLDYVIVHELCHLIELNHSQQFWAHVELYMPDFEVRRRQLLAIPLRVYGEERVLASE